MKSLVRLAVGLATTGALVSPTQSVAVAPECEPACNAATTQVADRLVAPRLANDEHLGWLATVLDQYGYEGRRWAEITRIPGGHGKLYVGVIHVPRGRSTGAARALSDFWFAQRGQTFVLPLVTQYDTQGGSGEPYRRTAKWAAQRLGPGWHVVAAEAEPAEARG